MMKILNDQEVAEVSAAGAGFFTDNNGLMYFLTFPNQSQACVDAYLADSQYRIDNNGRTNLSLNSKAVDVCGGFRTVSEMQFLEIIQTH